MGDVRLAPQRIQHNYLRAPNPFHSLRRDVARVGEVSEILDPKAQHRQLGGTPPRLPLQNCPDRRGWEWFARAARRVGEFLLELIEHTLLGVHGHVALLLEIIGPDVMWVM